MTPQRACRRQPGLRGHIGVGIVPLVAVAFSSLAAAAPTTGPVLSAAEAQAVVTPVPQVDLPRYAGVWHEIARLPNPFQRRCARQTLARYRLRGDGGIEVLNQCRRANGGVLQALGIARVVDPASRSTLRVSLVSFLGWRPFWGDYWIIGLDPGYRWAVVGEPRRRFGWVLARTPKLDRASLQTIGAILVRNGYDPAAFRPSLLNCEDSPGGSGCGVRDPGGAADPRR